MVLTMTNNAFFDTNIIVYFATTSDAKSQVSEKIMRDGGLVSVQVLNEFVSVTRTKYKMPWPTLSTSLSCIRLICPVVPLTIATHERGIAVSEHYGYRIYDSMIIAAALLAGCTTLYSEDMHHGQVIDGMQIVNPYQ